MSTFEVKLAILQFTQSANMDELKDIFAWVMEEVEVEEAPSTVTHLTPVQ